MGNGPSPAQKILIPTEVKDRGLVAKRRRQIVDAAVRLIVAKGFHKTTTREIARACGFSIGTLYEYVASKEDVLFLVCEAIHQEAEARLREKLRFTASGASALEAGIKVYFQVCDQLSDHILLIYQESKNLTPDSRRYVLEHEENFVGIFRELLQKGVADYTLRPLNLDEIELMAQNITVSGHMWTFRRWALSKKFSLKEYSRQQVGLIMGQLT